MWDLKHTPPDQWTLLYHEHHPMYQAIPEPANTANKLAGRRSFIAEICAWGLLDWALFPLHTGDTSKLELLKQNATNGDGDPFRDQYFENLERLVVVHHL